jgi:hypothetical protein
MELHKANRNTTSRPWTEDMQMQYNSGNNCKTPIQPKHHYTSTKANTRQGAVRGVQAIGSHAPGM